MIRYNRAWKANQGRELGFNQSPNRIGMLAGGIAIAIALLAMQLVSRVIAPWMLVSEFLPRLLAQELIGYTGELARYLLGGRGNIRMVVAAIILFLIAGSWLGRWTIEDSAALNQRVMQAAAIFLFVTFTMFYLLDARLLEFFLQEILLSLAISFLVFAVVLQRLLAPNSTRNLWRILGGVAVIGLIFIVFDARTW